MKSKGKMAELRLDEEHSRVFLEKRMGRPLSDREFYGIHSWSQGWEDGMKLLTLMIQEYGSVHEWAARFNGVHRYFTDYFSGVWAEVPQNIRRFLLQTAVLDGFDDLFCRAIRGEDKLEEVFRHNLFIVKEGNNYRYEPLFREFLREKLHLMPGAKRKEMFALASVWCVEHEKPAEAVDLALQAGEKKRAASLIVRFAPEFLKGDQWVAINRWTGLPSKLEGKQKAQVLLFYCWVHFLKQAFAGLNEFLEETEQAISECRLPDGYYGELLLLRSFVSLVTKDVDGAEKRCDGAFSLLGGGGVFLGAKMNLNIREAQVTRGKIGLDGRPGQAIRYYRHFRKYRSLIPETFAGFANIALAETAYETNHIKEARESAEEALRIAKKDGNISMWVPAVVVYTQILQKETAFEEGLSFIEEAKRAAKGEKRIWELLLAAQEVRLLLRQGNIRKARHLVHEYILHGKHDEGQLHEFESLSFVRVLVAAGDYERAEFYLDELLLTAESRDRYGTRIEIMVLQAVVFQKTNRIRKGLEVLAKVIEFARKEEVMRTFLDEGEPIFDLLCRLNEDSAYVTRLLNAFREELGSPSSGLDLTKRESDVLQMMGQGFTNKEIADAINVTVGTVKGYATILFKKLEVRNRTQAVARAREMNLYE